MHSRVYWLHGIGNDPRTFFLFFTLSTVCHLILFGMFIFVPNLKTERKSALSVINVSMVALPVREKTPAPKVQPPAENKIPVVTSKTVSEVSPKQLPKVNKEKIKRSLKKETFRSSKVLKRAITKIKDQITESRPDQISQALDRLKDKVEKTVEPDRQNRQAAKGPAAVGGPETDSKRVLELIDIYRVEVAYQVQKNWAFSEQLAGGRSDLSVELVFKIMPNGEIRDIWFDKRSGNNYLDESAKKAVLKSNPVRPHPPGIVKPFVSVGLRFTPKGVQ